MRRRRCSTLFMKQMTSLHPKDSEIPDDLMVQPVALWGPE